MFGLWNTDYLEGSEVIDSSALVELFVKKYGPPAAAPNGAVFSKDHLKSLMPDSKVVVLTRENLEKFVDAYERTAAWYKWLKEKGDCDSEVVMFSSDMIKGAIEEDFPHGIANMPVSYVSKSRRRENRTWSGYHGAPCIAFRDERTGDHDFVIKQVRNLTYGGAWQDPAEEMLFWTFFEGMH